MAWVQPVPTYAWRRTFDNLNRDDKVSNLVTDVSGNVYMQYSSSGTGATCHLAKVSPANNLIFDKSGTEFGGFRATGCCISPPVSGKQYIWVTGVVTSVTPNPAYFACLDNDGNFILEAELADAQSRMNPVGCHADASGNLMLALWDSTHSGGDEFPLLRMVTIDRTDTVISDHLNTTIDPDSAYWNTRTNSWIVSGRIVNDPYSGQWGSYDPSGSFQFGDTSFGSHSSAQDTYNSYKVNPLPGNWIGVIRNHVVIDNSNSTYTFFHYVQVYDAGNRSFWSYGAPGYGLHAAAFDSFYSLLYVTSNPSGLKNDNNQTVEKLKWDGTLVWQHTHQPVQQIYPTLEGYFGMEAYNPTLGTQAIFLEHYIDATNTYDWGRSYTGTASVWDPTVGGFASFQNFFYVANSVRNNTSGYDVILERFVTGITLASVTCARTVKQGTQLPVTINLNGNVAGAPLTVALNSSSKYLLLPNGKQGQNFQVPVGQNHIVVMLTAQAVSSNQSLLLTAIQNGVRRTAVTTVTP